MNSRKYVAIGLSVAALALGAASIVNVSATPTGTVINGNASTVNASSDCDGVVVGWHFVLPDGGDNPRPTFVSITAVFVHAGTVTYSGPFTHGGTQTPDNGTGFTTRSNDTLVSATAVASGADSDDFFVLSSIICSETPTPTNTPTPSTSTPTPSTSTPTPSTATPIPGTPTPSVTNTPTPSPSASATPTPSTTEHGLSNSNPTVGNLPTPNTGSDVRWITGGVMVALGLIIGGLALRRRHTS